MFHGAPSMIGGQFSSVLNFSQNKILNVVFSKGTFSLWEIYFSQSYSCTGIKLHTHLKQTLLHHREIIVTAIVIRKFRDKQTSEIERRAYAVVRQFHDFVNYNDISTHLLSLIAVIVFTRYKM